MAAAIARHTEQKGKQKQYAMGKTKIIAYAAGAAVLASFIVLFVGLSVFGFQLTSWAEWQGEVVGVVGTIAAVAGAALGLWMASRAERRIT